MKNWGNSLGVVVFVAAVAIYLINQEFGEGAAVAAILFASHAICIMIGYGMGIGGVRSGMQALNEHDKIHARYNAMDKRMETDLFRTVLTGLKVGMRTGDLRARAYRDQLIARQRQALPAELSDDETDPYIEMDSNQSFDNHQW